MIPQVSIILCIAHLPLCIPPPSARAIVWLPPYVLSHGIWFGALYFAEPDFLVRRLSRQDISNPTPRKDDRSPGPSSSAYLLGLISPSEDSSS